jgi:hypothetical protein
MLMTTIKITWGPKAASLKAPNGGSTSTPHFKAANNWIRRAPVKLIVLNRWLILSPCTALRRPETPLVAGRLDHISIGTPMAPLAEVCHVQAYTTNRLQVRALIHQ